jgi:DNA-binding transcriptional regulator LsrR (DeoR family)
MGIVGDFNYHLLDKKGDQVTYPEIVTDIGDETTGSLVKSIGLNILRERADRGCKIMISTTGAHKAEAVITTFRNRYANWLLTDETVADRIINES